MKPIEPLPLFHSWPIFDLDRRFDLGWLEPVAAPGGDCVSLADRLLAQRGIGRWQCDLGDERLSWSPEVHDMFGLPRAARLWRADAVALYCEESRAAMERLRAYAIKHCRGFTLDVEVRAGGMRRRWIRLVAAPVCEGDRVVRLHGLNQDVTHRYS